MEAAGRSMFRHEEQKMAVPKSIVGENLVIKKDSNHDKSNVDSKMIQFLLGCEEPAGDLGDDVSVEE